MVKPPGGQTKLNQAPGCNAQMKHDDYIEFISRTPDCPGIQGRNRFINSVVFVPFVMIYGEYHILFQKRAEEIRQGGEICFPGGRFDGKRDADFEQTAVRETVEELGIPGESVRVDGRLDTFIPSLNSIIEVFVGRIDVKDADSFNINKEEVDEIFLIPVSRLMRNQPEEIKFSFEVRASMDGDNTGKMISLLDELGLTERYSGSWGEMSSKVYVYREPECLIWGFTADILKELMDFIRG